MKRWHLDAVCRFYLQTLNESAGSLIRFSSQPLAIVPPAIPPLTNPTALMPATSYLGSRRLPFSFQVFSQRLKTARKVTGFEHDIQFIFNGN
jgi:hypothetical protein